MALRRSRLTLIFINVILLFALCAKPISSQGKEDVPPPPLPKLDLLKSSGSQNGDPLWYIQHLEQLKWYIEDYAAWFPSRQACPAVSSQPGKHCYSQCQENYAAASELVTSSLESLNKPDIPKAKCDLGNVATNIQKCQDCFEQTEKDQAMTDINVFLIKQTQDFIEVLNKVKGVQKLSVGQNDKEELPPLSLPKLGAQKSLGDKNEDPTKTAINSINEMSGGLASCKDFFQRKGQCPHLSPEVKNCCDQCLKNIDHAVDCAKVTIESVNKQDIAKAKGDFSGVTVEIQTCINCLTVAENGENADTKTLNDYTKQAASDCLDALNKAENGVQKLSVDKNDDATKRAIEQLEGIKHDL